jgi:hypothetical protein
VKFVIIWIVPGKNKIINLFLASPCRQNYWTGNKTTKIFCVRLSTSCALSKSSGSLTVYSFAETWKLHVIKTQTAYKFLVSAKNVYYWKLGAFQVEEGIANLGLCRVSSYMRYLLMHMLYVYNLTFLAPPISFSHSCPLWPLPSLLSHTQPSLATPIPLSDNVLLSYSTSPLGCSDF